MRGFDDRPVRALGPGEPCGHPGCLSHVSHPCEGCGRIAGRYPAPAASVPVATPHEQHMAVMEEGHKLTGAYIREHFVDEDSPAATAEPEGIEVPVGTRGDTIRVRTGSPMSSADAAAFFDAHYEALDYPAAARSIALNLAEFCDESLAYPEMIAEAARRAATTLAVLRARETELLTALVEVFPGSKWADELAARAALAPRQPTEVETRSCELCGTTQKAGEPSVVCTENERAEATYER